MCLVIQFLGSDITLSDLRAQAVAHYCFNSLALDAIENRRIRNTADLFDTEFLQLLRGLFCFLWEQTLLLGHRLEKCDSTFVVSSLGLVFRGFQLSIQRGLTLFHLSFEGLLNHLNIELAARAFNFFNWSAIGGS